MQLFEKIFLYQKISVARGKIYDLHLIIAMYIIFYKSYSSFLICKSLISAPCHYLVVFCLSSHKKHS